MKLRPYPRSLLAILGPTAVGKTALSLRVAKELGGEVVNADSRQVYRGMDIGTAKPTADERAQIHHWLVDVADPDEPFSLGRYLELAEDALKDCWARAVLPVLVGGTGQYVWALLEGWQVPRVPPDREFRADLQARVERDGPQPLIDELAAVDPAYAARVDQRNIRRVIRALEVYHHTGRPLSAWQTRKTPDFTWKALGLAYQRAELYGRIDARIDAMMSAGLVDEVRALVRRGYRSDLPAMSGIGYRQICQHLAGQLSLDEAIARMKTETHRLARTQHNWFRQTDDRIQWVDLAAHDPFTQALSIVESNLG